MIRGASIYRSFKLDTPKVTANACFNGRCLSGLQSIIAQAKSIANGSSDEGKVAPSNTKSTARPKLNTNKAAIDNNININNPKLDGVNNSESSRTSLSSLMKDASVDKLGRNNNSIQSGVQKFSSSVDNSSRARESSDSSQSVYGSSDSFRRAAAAAGEVGTGSRFNSPRLDHSQGVIGSSINSSSISSNTGRKTSFSSIMESYRDEDSVRRNNSMRSATMLSTFSKASSWMNNGAVAAELFNTEGLSMRTSFMNARKLVDRTKSELKRPNTYSKNATTPHSKKMQGAASSSPRADNEGDIPIEIYDHRYNQQRQKMAHKREEFSQKYGPSLSASKKPMGASSTDVHVDMSNLKRRTMESLRYQHQDSDKTASTSSMNKPKGPATIVTEVIVPGSGLTIRDLSSKLSLRLPDLLKKLVEMGELPETALRKDRNSNNSESDDTKLEDKLIDADTAELIVLEMGYIAKRVEDKNQARVATITDRPSMHALHHLASELQVRSPVVCVMGHVDHGKTTLLDSLRHLEFNLDRAVTDGATVKKNKKQQIVADVGDDDAEQDYDKESSLVKATDAVAGTEAGGITQKLSAFSVDMVGNRRVVFLDTPGHAAFSTMRSHGAVATDIVVLVVAIDDGVRPQTLEALKMAQDTNSSIIIALNKIDKIPYEDRSKARTKVLTQLMTHNLIAEEFGGEVQVVEVAGRTGEGLKELVDGILMQADLLELQSSFKGQAEAIVLDASVSKGRGVEAEVLLKWGELSVGDPIVVGSSYGKVKMMVNAKGQSLRTAYPSDSVRLLGLRSLPMTGQEMLSVASDNIAREIAERRQRDYEAKRLKEEELNIKRALQKQKLAELEAAKSSQDVMSKANNKGGAAAAMVDTPVVATAAPSSSTVHVVIKADGVCTLEALKKVVSNIAARALEYVRVEVVGSSVGDITSSDLDLLSSGDKGLVLGFNVNILDGQTRSLAKQLDIAVCRDNVIYRLEDELVRVMSEYLPKERVLEQEGIARVQQVFHLSGKSSAVVAGVIVESGRLRSKGGSSSSSNQDNNSTGGVVGDYGYVFRVKRNGQVVMAESKGGVELKRFKTLVHEVESGNECGVSLDGFDEYQEGDELECLKVIWRAQTQVLAPAPDESMSAYGSSNKKP